MLPTNLNPRFLLTFSLPHTHTPHTYSLSLLPRCVLLRRHCQRGRSSCAATIVSSVSISHVLVWQALIGHDGNLRKGLAQNVDFVMVSAGEWLALEGGSLDIPHSLFRSCASFRPTISLSCCSAPSPLPPTASSNGITCVCSGIGCDCARCVR